MRVVTTFDDDFDSIYNRFNGTDKGKKLLELEGIGREQLDVGNMSHAYHTAILADVSVNQNANSNGIDSRGPNNYAAEIVKGVLKLEGYYLVYRYAVKRLGEERADDILESIWSGDVYLHDASGAGISEPYCMAFSTGMLMGEGRPYGQLRSVPAKKAKSFIAQVIETTMDLSQSFAGAVAPGDLLVNYAYFAKREQLSDKAVIDDLQSFVHVMNNQFRVGGESPFTNLSIFDMDNLHKLFDHYSYPDGSKVDFEYVMHIQKMFGEWFAKGDPSTGLPYRFPIVTLNICRGDDGEILDEEFLDWVSKINTATGCFNIYVNSGNKIASCCRLVNDRERMQFKSDSFGNGGLNLGSHRVVTLNLPRIALKAKGDKEKFKVELQRVLDVARDLLLIHRYEILKRRVDQGFLKFYKPLGWFNMNHMFSTIGIIGVYEMCELFGEPIRVENGKLNGGVEFAAEVLKFIEGYALVESRTNGCSFNVEQIPGETTAIKFAEKDRIAFGEDRQPFLMYSNQFIPLTEDATMPDRIAVSGRLMDIMSGGAILHLNFQEQIKDPEITKKLIKYLVSKGVSHAAINYSFGTCERGHTTVCGSIQVCPECGAFVAEHLTRVVGYFTKVSSWNKTRRVWEFPKRRFE